MIRYLLLSMVVTMAFFYQLPETVRELPSFYPVAYFALDGPSQLPLPSEITATPPFNGIIENGTPPRFLRPDAAPRELKSNSRYFAPFHGRGYFQYEKVGSKIFFNGRDGEQLWEKEFNSYPVSGPSGKLIFLLTGDNNRIELLDWSGNPIGVESISGNFLSDYDFATRTVAAALAFAGGDAYLIDEKGKVRLHHSFAAPGVQIFLKSCAISPDGSLIAVHHLSGNEDRITLLAPPSDEKQKSEVVGTFSLASVYPHLLHFAVSDHGLLLAAPDRTTFYNRKGEVLFDHKRTSTGVYRPVFADYNYFIYGDTDGLVAMDENGARIATVRVPDPDAPYRIIASKSERQIFVQLKNGVVVYQLLFPDSAT